MSDMMRGGGAPPARPAPGGAPPGGGGMASKMSMFNPTDVAAKASRGDLNQNQTVGQFLQKNFGVSPQDPVQKLFQSIKGQAQNSTALGKIGGPPTPGGARPGAPPPAGPAPGGAPAPRPAAPAPGGMQGLMSKMGGGY